MGTVYDQQFEHLLRRAGFGARPDELATVRTLSVDGAVDQLVNYEQIADEHAQHLRKLVSAFQDLYSAMPDQQKQVADQVFRANAEARTQSHHARNG